MRKVALGDTIYFHFTTRAFATGVPTVLSGTPTLAVVEMANATPITASDTLSVDFATVVGLNQIAIAATTANGFEYGKSYAIYIEAGTVGGVSVVGEVVAEFQIETAAEEATRLFTTYMYPSATLAASASHNTTTIDMTGVVDANTKADGLKNEILAVHDITNDTVELVRCTGSTVSTLLATVQALDDGGPMSFTCAVGDHVWRIGQYTAASLLGADLALDSALTTLTSNVATAQNDLDLLTGTDGATLATAQALYAPATAAALATHDGKLDTVDANVDILVSGVISGFTAVTGTLATTSCTTDITGYADNELIGRVIVFTGGTAAGQAAAITDYASASGLVTFTGGIATAPANLDAFVIV